MHRIKKLLENNRIWAEETEKANPGIFKRLSQQQKPDFLWIGCADSRVPANEIAGMLPGEVFVHRNVANQVIHTDINCLSVIQYAVDVLKVEHIIVCGHYGCGGVIAAMDSQCPNGLIDNWLRHINRIYRRNEKELLALEAPAQREDRLCELNVIQQALNVSHSTIVRDAWARGQQLTVHGFIYSINDGLLKNLITMHTQDDATTSEAEFFND